MALMVLRVFLSIMHNTGAISRDVDRDARIVIIGAGAAGISAANHLFNNGFTNVTILEGKDRVGGRIFTKRFGDGIIEDGATWIHGIGKKNSLYTLAQSAGLPMERNLYLDYSKPYCWLTERGNCLNSKAVKKAWKIFEQIETDMDNGEDIRSKGQSSYDYFQRGLNEKIEKVAENKREQVRLMFNTVISFFGGEEGDDPRRLSAYHYELGHMISYKDVVLPNGFIELLEALAEVIPASAVKFQRYVTNIDWQDPTKKIAKITCEVNGATEEYIADHVIVTSSLGHLKQFHDTLFTPSLPQRKVAAIQRFGFGQAGKIFLYYDTPFWQVGGDGITIVWDDIDDAYSQNSWYKSVFFFSEVSTSPNTLLAWVHGDAVTHMENVTETELAETCTFILRKFLKNPEIPEPTKIGRSIWSTDPLFFGAYSYYSVNSERGDVAHIAEPLTVCDKPVLCFAGEATHVKWFSYAHGATSSGIREANRIMDFYT